MNTARIVVLTIPVGAGGAAACLASGPDKSSPAEPVAQLRTADVAECDIGLGQTIAPEDLQWQAWRATRARQGSTLALTLRSITDVNAVENTSDDQAPRQGGSVSIARYGVASSRTIQK